MNKKFLAYIRTILFSTLAALLFVILSLVFIEYQVEKDQAAHETKSSAEKASIEFLITKNSYMEEANPKDFLVNYRLGVLYGLKKDYKTSEIEFKKSISKAPYGEYRPYYRLALLLIAENRLEEAEALIDNLGEHPDKKLIKFKAKVFEKLGDAYYNKADYDDAASMYQKSSFYYKTIKSKHVGVLKGDIASSYVYLADEKVTSLDIDEAISYLNMAKSLIDAPIIKYKLAVLLIRSNPSLAYKYFDGVFKEAPELINYDTYSRFLKVMADEAEASGDYTLAELYDYKIKKLKEYFTDKILCFDDLRLEFAVGSYSTNLFRNKLKIKFECQFKNISPLDINSLYLTVVFGTKYKELYRYSQQMFDENSVLAAGKTSPIIDINTTTDKIMEENIPEEITAKIYVSKLENSSNILLQEIKIPMVKKSNFWSKLMNLKWHFHF